MKKILRCVEALACVLALYLPPASVAFAQKAGVDLLLVLATDVSRSVTASKFKLQREGYMAAITDPQILRAIKRGFYRRIAVTYVEWSGRDDQKVLVPWTTIDGAESARRFAALLSESPRAFEDVTAIGEIIKFATRLFDAASFESDRKVIDVSGDGVNNNGCDVASARDDAVKKDIVINGIAIRTLPGTSPSWMGQHVEPPEGLREYYRRNVVGGHGAFVEEAESFEAFGDAIRKKMIAEIADSRYK